MKAGGTTLTVGELREAITSLADDAPVRTLGGNVLAADVVHGGLLLTDEWED